MIAARRTQLLLLALAIVLLAATYAYPTLHLQQPTYRYVLVFDITESMNVADVPTNAAAMSRLTFAKQAAREALGALPCGSEVGFALFAGHRAFLLNTPVETCANFRDLTAMLNNIDWKMTWEARSEVAKGLFKSIKLMPQLPAETRVVFITDGHEAPPINPDVPPVFRGDPGAVAGLVVGVGGTEPVPIPKLDADDKVTGYWEADEVLHVDTFTADQQSRAGTKNWNVGTEHLSALRETYLQELAGMTGLGYLRLSDAESLADALREETLGIPRLVDSDVRWLMALLALTAVLASVLGAAQRPRRKATTA